MTSIIKTLFGQKRKPKPEEVAALDQATRVLQSRVALMAAQSNTKAAA